MQNSIMKVHNLVQGSPEWLNHRAEVFNASDAAAMLGCSKYKTRDQLLQEMATGKEKEVDASTQYIFDLGHKSEALARPLGEEIIGDDLYPITGTNDAYCLMLPLGASYDGITLSETEGFEHKSMNAEIRAAKTVSDLHKMYHVQMEQQMLVCQKIERILFFASKWEGEELLESKSFWYTSSPSLKSEILAGWKQFGIDLQAVKSGSYAIEAEAEVVEADAVMALPALKVQATGSITISDNLKRYGEELKGFIANINKEPETDQDFANAKNALTILQESESQLKAAKASVMAQITSIDDMSRMVDYFAEMARETRLTLEKIVVKQEKKIKQDKADKAQADWLEHFNKLNDELKLVRMELSPPDWVAAMKNKRTLTSLQSALNDALAAGKVKAETMALDYRKKLKLYSGTDALGYGFLFNDMQSIIAKPFEDFELILSTRVSRYIEDENAKHKAEMKRMEAEANMKAEREAAAKIEQETIRIRAEERAKAEAEVKIQVPVSPEIENAIDESVKNTKPSRESIIQFIADAFRVTNPLAEQWLVEEFSTTKKGGKK